MGDSVFLQRGHIGAVAFLVFDKGVQFLAVGFVTDHITDTIIVGLLTLFFTGLLLILVSGPVLLAAVLPGLPEKLGVSVWIVVVQVYYTMTDCIWRRSFWRAHACLLMRGSLS